MLFKNDETIVAPATPIGRGALAVVRLSGPDAKKVLHPLYPQFNLARLTPRMQKFALLYEPDGALLDETLVVYFAGPASYTGEDVIEISCHGGGYIVNRLLELLLENGARLAEPGEFTLRAYLNGKFDLTQAEAVADLIGASNKAAHALAVRQLRGGFSEKLQNIRQSLLNFAALIELELDFAEEDVVFADRAALITTLNEAVGEITRLIDGFKAGAAVKNGIPTVILGKPNAGKSTLLNALLQENRAIVSDIPGTTRDVLEERFYLGPYEFRLIDTAGLRVTHDPIEAEGVARAKSQVETAAICCVLFDATQENIASARQTAAELPFDEETVILFIANKTDLLSAAPQNQAEDVLSVSAQTGAGLDVLKERLIQTAQTLFQTDQIVATNQRHLTELKRARAALQEVENGLFAGLSGELVALDLRTALRHIGALTGEIDSDEILGNIFSKFCIGK